MKSFKGHYSYTTIFLNIIFVNALTFLVTVFYIKNFISYMQSRVIKATYWFLEESTSHTQKCKLTKKCRNYFMASSLLERGGSEKNKKNKWTFWTGQQTKHSNLS